MSSVKPNELPNDSDKPNQRATFAIDQTGLTRIEAAHQLGINPTYLSEVCSGSAPLSAKTAKAFQRAFGFFAKWLLTGEGPYRVGEDEPQYILGPLSRPNAPESPVRVIARRAYHCSACHAEVSEFALDCHKCGRPLDWNNPIAG